MRQKKWSVLALAALVIFIFAAVQPALAAERIVKLKIPGCGWPESEQQVRITGEFITGVKKVQASFISGTAVITFDDSVVSLDKIIENYKRNGFTIEGQPEWIK
jgi:copper chaperone CopZ